MSYSEKSYSNTNTQILKHMKYSILQNTMNHQIKEKTEKSFTSKNSFDSEIQTMRFHFISLHNQEETMPWASPEHDFITALILPDISVVSYHRMVHDR